MQAPDLVERRDEERARKRMCWCRRPDPSKDHRRKGSYDPWRGAATDEEEERPGLMGEGRTEVMLVQAS